MINYKLYNKAHDKDLVHPKLGLWTASSLKEAHDMKNLVYQYLEINGWESMEKDIVIKNCETDEEIY